MKKVVIGGIIGIVAILAIIIVSYFLLSEKEQLIGGCAGVSLEYRQECCDNWAEENDFVHIQCEGEWSISENQCVWVCVTPAACAMKGEIAMDDATGEYVECCEGLKEIANVPDGTPEECENFFTMEGWNSICIACDDGICNEYENRCTCPEDCEESKTCEELIDEVKDYIDEADIACVNDDECTETLQNAFYSCDKCVSNNVDADLVADYNERINNVKTAQCIDDYGVACVDFGRNCRCVAGSCEYTTAGSSMSSKK